MSTPGGSCNARRVAPCAGAWIEMYLALTMVRIWHVAPCAGAWIEIFPSRLLSIWKEGRPLRGGVD